MEKKMIDTKIPVCKKHNIKREWRPTTFEYKEDNITVRISNVMAWVCPKSGNASFTPQIMDELIETVQELVLIAKKSVKRKSSLTEYFLSVGNEALTTLCPQPINFNNRITQQVSC
ncbi:MAG: hypothetical protein OMM_09210 [Candidatus Magnetoglobus multicellularis str. Araruama]|uniref:Uncharacterized protein n=1 Tax=Candidatus Magnetoglobus multicellularis str. Araruama TaxID=890399 RepID=A0A1V1P4S9_9BACT|nr:MAG: hypothetical protein OMM_09210 [Candidatus Magnetoglobus multicellularis str. Araruama]